MQQVTRPTTNYDYNYHHGWKYQCKHEHGNGRKCDMRYRTSGFRVSRSAEGLEMDGPAEYAKRLRAARVKAEQAWNELDQSSEPRFVHHEEDQDAPARFEAELNPRELRAVDAAALATPGLLMRS